MSDIILFFGKTNPEFSNFYLSDFTIDGETYPSVEHYFMWEKAYAFDPDGDAIKQMSNEKTPQQMKKLGRQVKNFDAQVWDYDSAAIMYKGLMAKFCQNEELKKKLLDTGDATLAEASPFDRKWGIGMGVSNPDSLDPEKWKGENLLGELLMKARHEIQYPTVTRKFYHLKLDIKDTTGTESERYERMEDVFRDVQDWLNGENKYSLPAVTYFDYQTMHLESSIMTVKPMVGEPWEREPDESEYPRMEDSLNERFGSVADSIELGWNGKAAYNDISSLSFMETKKTTALLVTRPHPDEFAEYCMQLMYGLADFPTDEDGNPRYLYGVFDFRAKPFFDETD